MMCEIDYQTATAFLLPKHYSGRVPTISKAFGWYNNNDLVAVCTFGKPASPTLCKGVCGAENSKYVYELNRLCRLKTWKQPLSKFVGWCLRKLKKENWIVVSYSDTAMNHHGYVYQACNFIYTGCSKSRTDKYVPDGKHCRHYKQEDQGQFRRIRSGKHRYIYFCTNSKSQKKKWIESLNYKIEPYPKGDNNPDYELGDFLKPELIKIS